VTLALIDEAVAAGASLEATCELLGLSSRTVQRWRQPAHVQDDRAGPRQSPANRLSEPERASVLRLVNSAPYRDLSPKQIVPRLADEGRYVASESTMYRLLREAGQLTHRLRSKPPERRRRPEHVASAPNQVWSWDITYLKGPVRGSFLYLYLVIDLFSRRIMGWQVHEVESTDLAAALIRRICAENRLDPKGIVLHSDNGGPMKGSTMLATLQALGIVPSFSRPSVSDDNPFSEALFRTLKYRPAYPDRAFDSADAARAWVGSFTRWYNHEHLHSGIRFVTPESRYRGLDTELLAARCTLYERARQDHPERWSRGSRNWTPVGAVALNPQQTTQEEIATAA
jgi:putative transposase